MAGKKERLAQYPCDPAVEGTPACAVFMAEGECRMDLHHKAYQRRKFARGLAKAYRNLEIMQEMSCRQRHQDIHAADPDPEPPSVEEMREVVNNARLGDLALRGIEIA